MTTGIRGATSEQRQGQRAKRTRERRAGFYVDLMRAAATPKERLRHACDFLRAVAKDLPGPDVDDLARTVTQMADKRNQR